MAEKIAKRGISIFIDGKEVSNSVKGIRAEMSRLINEQNKMTIGSKEYVSHAKKIAQLKLHLDQHYESQKKIARQYGVMDKSAGGFFSRVASGFNKYFTLATTALASITGISFAFKKLSEDVAEMSDVYANVMKYTGESAEGVAQLNEELKKMDTRTSREELNRLLGEAGKLGIKGKENLLQFARAADVIQVALGEDLGEDAVKSIGKLADMFGVSDRIGIEKAMLAVGSSINEVAQNSTASEPYLLEFTNRLSGIGKTAGLTIPQIMGFGAVLDQNAQQVEMSGTALNKFISTLATKSEEVAKAVGIPAKELKRVVREDMNEALMMVFRELNKKGGLVDLAPLFKDLGAEGARAGSVITILADKFTDLQREQALANKAFNEGTSVLKEFDVQNNTLKARLEKSRKEFKDISLELGESLNPILLTSTRGLTYLIKALVELPKWLRENKGMLITLISVITLYTIGVNKARIATLLHSAAEKGKIVIQRAGTVATLAATAAQALFTGNLKRAAVAMRSLNAQMKINPYVALGVALAALVISVYKLATRTTDAKKALKDFNVEALKQQRELNQIFNAYKRANEGTAEKTRLLKLIKEKYGPYIKDLIDEKGKISDIEKAQKLANDAIREQIALKIRNQYIDEYTSKEIKEQASTLTKIRERIEKSKGETIANLIIGEIGNTLTQNINDPMRKGLDGVKKILADYGLMNGVIDKREFNSLANSLASSFYRINNKTEEFKSVFKGLVKDVDQVVVATNGEDPNTPSGTTPAEEDSKYKDAEKALEQTSKVRQLALLEMYQQMQITEDLYNKLSEAETILALEEKLKLQKKFGEDTVDTELALLNAKVKLNKEDLKRIEEHNKLLESMTLKTPFETGENTPAIDAENYTLALRLKILEAFHNKGLLSEQEYLEDIAELYKGNQQEINKYIKTARLKSNQEDFDSGIIGRKAYLQNVKQITKEYWEEIFADANEVAESISSVANAAANVVNTIVEAESAAVDAKYASQLQAAKKAGQDTTQIEEQIEQEKLDIKKKYADLEFGIKVANIIGDTAVAVMKMWAEGGVLGPGLAVLAGAAGVAQLAVANQQRQQIKNMWTGGFTEPGDKYDPRGIVHAGEFVASQESVNNPYIRPLLNAIDMAQRQGTASHMKKDDVIRALRFSSGFNSGGYVSEKQQKTQDVVNNADAAYIDELTNAINRLNKRLDEGIESYSVISGRKGVKNALDKYDSLITNVTRKR